MNRCHATLLAALATLTLSATASAAPPEQQSPLPNVTGCDSIDAFACMLPFPNDLYTKADPTTDTGRRIDFSLLAMPRNIAGKPIDPTDQNRADGFSPGSMIITKIAGLDTDEQLDAIRFGNEGVARVWNPEDSQRKNAPIAVIDAETGEKHMVWAELDHSQDALGASPKDRVLIIRPGKNFLEGRRYIVALRLPGLAVDPTFKAFRDGGALTNPFDQQRRAHFEDLFKTLAGAGIARADLTQAWDFTVASEESLSGRMLTIRDDAFRKLGDRDLGDLKVQGRAPAFTLTRITDYLCDEGVGFPQDAYVVDRCPSGEDGPIAYDVKGTFDVPCYLDNPGCLPANSKFILDPTTDLPVQIPGNVMKVNFRCRIPKIALANPGQARPSLYGHGLLGGMGEIGQGQLRDMMAEYNFVFCATNWAGMAAEDLPNVLSILPDISRFNTLADRVQQGMLNFLYLGRLMIHPDGLTSQAPFKVGNDPVLNTERLYYDGNSQGGIIGGALAAVAPDFTRAVLGVPGSNYSTLLNRSVDFGAGKPPTEGGIEYAWPLYQSYPQANERQLLFNLMQMLWDRAETNGYAQHMSSDPYPNTPEHRVLMTAGYADHQVSNLTAEIQSRTMGAKVLKRDMIRPWRAWTLKPFVGLRAVDGELDDVSVLTVWDGGSRPVPNSNTTISRDIDDDPHEWVRRTKAVRAMKSAFLSFNSRIVDTCGGFCDTDQKSPQADYSVDPLAADGVSRP